MGQKVNPIAFRTGVMVGWKSRWYASKKEFGSLLLEDFKAPWVRVSAVHITS